MKPQKNDLGTTPQGESVIAATDSAGPQVIVMSESVHLLSRPLANHEAAVNLGNQVVIGGTSVYDQWFDLKNGGLGVGLFAVFGGDFR